MITKIENANVELDEYTIICSINNETLDDFLGIVKREINKWGELEIIVPVRNLICLLK